MTDLLIARHLRDTCTVLKATAETDPDTDEDSGSPDWSSPAESAEPCSIQPQRAAEPGTDSNVSVSDYVGYFLPDSAVLATSRVSWRGRTLEVVGEPGLWIHGGGSTRQDHIQVALRRFA